LAKPSSPRKRSSSRNRRGRSSAEGKARASDLLLVEQLHAPLAVGLLVNDAETLEVLHAKPPLPGFAEADSSLDEIVGSRSQERDPRFPASELASLVHEVAASGGPRHLSDFRDDVLGQDTRWWSASLQRIDTDTWGPVVVTLAVDRTDHVRARDLLQERERRRLALQQAIAAVPGESLLPSLQQIAETLVPAFPIDVAVLRLLDADGKLHLVAAAGFRPAEIRRLALEPLDERRVEAMIEGSRHPLVGPLGLRWVDIRWVTARDEPIGTLTVGARSERRLSEPDLALLDAAAAQLGSRLKRIEREARFLRSRSLELARASAEANDGREALVQGLRARELAILRLYGEGLGTHQIAELLVLSAHTVRTHVRNALRRLGVRSRREALEVLAGTDIDRAI
jgi:DNA-binding CsgD family transcriptional regulator